MTKDPQLFHLPTYAVIGIAGGVLIVFILCLLGRAKGKPNVIGGCVISAEGLEKKRKVYAQVTCLGETITTTSIVQSDSANWNSSFTWSFRGRKEEVVVKDVITFEVFEAMKSVPSSNDMKLITVDLTVKSLLDAGVGHEINRVLSDSSKHVINVRAGLYSNNLYFKFLDRLSISWQQESRKLSFWTRVFTLPLSLFIAYSSAMDVYHSTAFWPRALALVDCIIGTYFIWQSLGVYFESTSNPRNLSFAWSLCLGVMGWMFAAGKWLDRRPDMSHWFRLGSVSILFVGYLVADLRGEPGSGWLSVPGRLIFTQYST